MRKVLKWLAVVLVGLSSLFIMVNIHEIGHTLLARLLGDPDSTYYLVRIYPGGGMCLGCNIYDESKLTWAGTLLTSLGGALFTQAGFWLQLWLSSLAGVAAWLRGLVRLSAWIFFVDLPLQMLQAFRSDVAQPENFTQVDFADVSWLLSQRVDLPIAGIRVILAVLCAAYIAGVIQWQRTRKGQ